MALHPAPVLTNVIGPSGVETRLFRAAIPLPRVVVRPRPHVPLLHLTCGRGRDRLRVRARPLTTRVGRGPSAAVNFLHESSRTRGRNASLPGAPERRVRAFAASFPGNITPRGVSAPGEAGRALRTAPEHRKEPRLNSHDDPNGSPFTVAPPREGKRDSRTPGTENNSPVKRNGQAHGRERCERFRRGCRRSDRCTIAGIRIMVPVRRTPLKEIPCVPPAPPEPSQQPSPRLTRSCPARPPPAGIGAVHPAARLHLRGLRGRPGQRPRETALPAPSRVRRP
ncbi:hypothetical protein H4W79_000207 [Nocardiopsis terrae]|uniref:Uncharacterized protein n=1 Tax=Nocardiopsis terrae TaxID=372655 RepID=A0ABR9HAG5_9ACTN|nr:hypothetical protein [Nocardiopsis terrae]